MIPKERFLKCMRLCKKHSLKGIYVDITTVWGIGFTKRNRRLKRNNRKTHYPSKKCNYSAEVIGQINKKFCKLQEKENIRLVVVKQEKDILLLRFRYKTGWKYVNNVWIYLAPMINLTR